MDDLAPAATPKKHIAERAEEIWRERRAKGYSTRAAWLAEQLAMEGYRLVEARIVRTWIGGWHEADGHVASIDNESPEGVMALQTEILANSRRAITEADLQAIHRGLLALIGTSEAIGKHVISRLDHLETRTVDDVGKLVDIMGRAAEAAERMSRASDYIRTRQVEQASLSARLVGDGESLNGEIMPPAKGVGSPPPHAMSGLAAFQRAVAAADVAA